MPLPRLPPAVSPWPGVPFTALREHSTGKGAGRVPMGPALPHTCRVTEPQLVTHGCSLPTPGTGVGTHHPHARRPHARLLAQGPLIPPPGRGSQDPKEKERHAPHREGAPEETGEPRRREPRSGAAMAPEGEASTHVRRGRRPPASTGVLGTARPSWGGTAEERKGQGG